MGSGRVPVWVVVVCRCGRCAGVGGGGGGVPVGVVGRLGDGRRLSPNSENIQM